MKTSRRPLLQVEASGPFPTTNTAEAVMLEAATAPSTATVESVASHRRKELPFIPFVHLQNRGWGGLDKRLPPRTAISSPFWILGARTGIVKES
jgi:hypothetical protein